MTNPEPLSARIATLELAAGNLPELHTLRQVIVQEIRNQQISLADIDERIAEGQRAELILQHLTDQTERVLASGELLRGQPDLPEPHEQAHPDSSASIRVDLDQDRETLPITEPSRPQQTPTETTETNTGDSINSTINSDESPLNPEQPTEPAPHELTGRERLAQWIATLTPTDVVTVRDASTSTGMPHSSAATYMTKAMQGGLLERLPGTGTPGVPSQYRLPGNTAGNQTETLDTTPPQPTEAAPEQPETSDTPSTTDDHDDLPPADPADDQEQDEEPAAPATTTGHRPSKKARVLEVMQREPDRTWTVTILAIEADMDEDDVRYGLTNLQNQFLAHAVPGTSPREYRLGKAPETTAQPVSTSTLPPIPARLSTDECEVFDTLRKIPDGLTQRLLGSRLNWSTARTEKAVQALTRAGHIGHNGDRLRVIPPEMQDGAA